MPTKPFEKPFDGSLLARPVRIPCSYGPPNGPSGYAQHPGTLGLAGATGEQPPQPGDSSAAQFRRSPTHLAPLPDLVLAVSLGAGSTPTLAHFASGYALGHGPILAQNWWALQAIT